MKTCVKCNKEKDLSLFNNNRSKPDGKDHYCRECRKTVNKKRDYRKYNETSGRVWNDKHPNFKKYYSRIYRNNNSAYFASKVQERNTLKRNASPKWKNDSLILEFYKEARRLTAETGIKHEVDHIVPIISDVVCGLHVECNLQILTKEENIKKGNKLL